MVGLPFLSIIVVAVLSFRPEFSVGQGTELDPGNGGPPPSDIKGYVQVVSVKLPGELNVLLDKTEANVWNTPHMVTKGTNSVAARYTMPGWNFRTTLIKESGSAWSVVELGKNFVEGNIHGNTKECEGRAKKIVTFMHLERVTLQEFHGLVQGEISRDLSIFDKEVPAPEELASGPPTHSVPVHGESLVGPTYSGVEGY